MSALPKATYRLNVIPIEISMAFFLEIGKNTKANLGFFYSHFTDKEIDSELVNDFSKRTANIRAGV